MEIKDIKVIEGKTSDEKLMVFYIGDNLTQGYRMRKEQLASLFSQLKILFKDES
jgi:hypothetical protein